MPQPRRLTDAEEAEMLAAFLADPRPHGAIARLARQYRLSWSSTREILAKAKCREVAAAEMEVSSETLSSGEGA